MKLKDLLKPLYRVLRIKVLYFQEHAILPHIVKRYFKKHPEIKRDLQKYRNIHEGKRCFIIGNGPSLDPKDLDKLKAEYTFASNFIGKIFSETDWRPNYFCVMDPGYVKKNIDDFLKYKKDQMFVAVYAGNFKSAKKYFHNENICFCEMTHGVKDIPKFSNNVAEIMYGGYSVTYCLLQLAVYMGFKEIYLLGVDHNYSVNNSFNGIIEKSDKKDHFYGNGNTTESAQIEGMTNAFISAKEYTQTSDVKIFNSTRGGNLEVFERIDLDIVLSK